MARTGVGMTESEVLALPAVVSVVTAGQALGIGRTKCYELIQNGEWPTRLLRIGTSYRVPTADLRSLLGIVDGPDSA